MVENSLEKFHKAAVEQQWFSSFVPYHGSSTEGFSCEQTKELGTFLAGDIQGALQQEAFALRVSPEYSSGCEMSELGFAQCQMKVEENALVIMFSLASSSPRCCCCSPTSFPWAAMVFRQFASIASSMEMAN